MKVPVGIRKVNLCQHPGCQKEGVPCYSASGDEESDGFYCSDHGQVHGFSYSADLSWGETEFFGFGNGLSVDYQEGLGAEFGEDESDFNRNIFNKIFDHEDSLKYYRGEAPAEASHYDPFPEKKGLRY